MGETSTAQRYAAGEFDDAKLALKMLRLSGSWTAQTVAMGARARMRNAVVAYHAGASWMGHPGKAAMLHMCKRNARLTAEVEHLRGVLRKTVSWSESAEHHESLWHCRVCGETGDLFDLHDEACPVLHARDALAREDGA